MGHGAAQAAQGSREHDARGGLVEREGVAGQHLAGTRRDRDRRHRRRSAGGIVRSTLRQRRRCQEHLRHRLLPAANIGDQVHAVQGKAHHHDRLQRGSEAAVRAWRAACSSAAPWCNGCATRCSSSKRRRTSRRSRQSVQGLGQFDSRARVHRPGRAALGPVCERHADRPGAATPKLVTSRAPRSRASPSR